MSDNIVNLFPHKQTEPDKLTDDDIEEFLQVLDDSLETFMLLSPHEKYNLYSTLVEFTKTSMGIMMAKKVLKID